jgi:hypothetical protein
VTILQMLVVGLVATVTLDLWQQIARLLFGLPITNWAMLARWFGHMPQGQFVQQDIGKAVPVRNERPLGWLVHYVVATSLGVLYLLLMEYVFHAAPGLVSAMLWSIVTIIMTWFVVEPALGAGFLASRTPNPTIARLYDFSTHIAYGVGIYLGVLAANAMQT